MPPFMSSSRAVFSLISCRNAIKNSVSRSGIGRGSYASDQFRRFGSLSGVERYSSNGFMSNDDARVSFGTRNVIQRRHFLGCGDGEEGGGELSKIYEERRVLGYSQEQLFNVVAAVDLYHGFVPWCQRSEVLKEYPDGSFDAELEIGFKFLVESYTSHVEFERPKWIKTTARDTGLFDHLINLWQFKPGPIAGTCDLHFHVDFKFNSPLYRQGHKQWLAEVQLLGVVNHTNIVKLLGYCAEDSERLLVYEMMSNRSLEDHLFTRNTLKLSWKQRLEIMLGAAQGLAYLHEVQVIYRDFKSSNVLLNEELHPKLSDFGLAREGPEGDNTHVTTMRVGTDGYAAPEYVETGYLRTHNDVYSFGVVLYEIITGRRTIERLKPVTEKKLLEWVKQYPVNSKSFRMIIDSKFCNQYRIDMVRRVARLADNCLKKNDKERPTMAYVVESLRKIIEESYTGDTTSSVAESSTRISVRA